MSNTSLEEVEFKIELPGVNKPYDDQNIDEKLKLTKSILAQIALEKFDDERFQFKLTMYRKVKQNDLCYDTEDFDLFKRAILKRIRCVDGEGYLVEGIKSIILPIFKSVRLEVEERKPYPHKEIPEDYVDDLLPKICHLVNDQWPALSELGNKFIGVLLLKTAWLSIEQKTDSRPAVHQLINDTFEKISHSPVIRALLKTLTTQKSDPESNHKSETEKLLEQALAITNNRLVEESDIYENKENFFMHIRRMINTKRLFEAKPSLSFTKISDKARQLLAGIDAAKLKPCLFTEIDREFLTIEVLDKETGHFTCCELAVDYGYIGKAQILFDKIQKNSPTPLENIATISEIEIESKAKKPNKTDHDLAEVLYHKVAAHCSEYYPDFKLIPSMQKILRGYLLFGLRIEDLGGYWQPQFKRKTFDNTGPR